MIETWEREVEPDLDYLFETATRRIDEKLSADLLRTSLNLTDRLNRRALLIAMDWESAKHNTERLRSKVRLHVISGAITLTDLYHAKNCSEEP